MYEGLSPPDPPAPLRLGSKGSGDGVAASPPPGAILGGHGPRRTGHREHDANFTRDAPESRQIASPSLAGARGSAKGPGGSAARAGAAPDPRLRSPR